MRLHYSQQVIILIHSLGEEGAALRRALESLKSNPVPEWVLPIPDRPGMYELFVDGYWNTYEVDRSNPSETVVRAIVVTPN